MNADERLISWSEIDRAMKDQNGIRKAIQGLEVMIAERETYPYAERLLANLYYQANDYAAAAEWYRRYLVHCPYDDRTRLWLAKSLTAQGQLQSADAVLNEVLESYPDYQDALALRFKVLAALGKGDQIDLQRLESLDGSGTPQLVVHAR